MKPTATPSARDESLRPNLGIVSTSGSWLTPVSLSEIMVRKLKGFISSGRRVHLGGALLAAALLALSAPGAAVGQIGVVPRPADIFGFEPGEDYHLADYSQLVTYFEHLATASPRVELVEIGESTLGRPIVVAIIADEATIRDLDRYKEINRKLTFARIPEEEARALAKEGKATVVIENGLHSTETGHAQHSAVLAYELATGESEEIRRIREETIVLLVPAMNPDGQDMVVHWYREHAGEAWELSLPELYHVYVGHDNNRDWAMVNQRETEAMTRFMYHEWHHQLHYSHHQEAPFPARISIAPFDDPVNQYINRLVTRGVSLMGTYMAKRFEEHEMSGVLSRLQFSMWRADGVRYAGYGHNVVGFHSETAHRSPTPRFYPPEEIPRYFSAASGTSLMSALDSTNVFYHHPCTGGWFSLSDAMDYMMTGSLAALDLAARLKEDWLFNKYRAGRQEIAHGESGGPYAYLLPEDQWDAGEAEELIRILRLHNAEVHRATAPFLADDVQYPAGTQILFAGQAFRPLLRLLLDIQVYPDRRVGEEGTPVPPYDLAGWTFPLAMGVNVVRVDEPFAAEVEMVGYPPARTGRVVGSGDVGFLLAATENRSFRAVNRLLTEGERVSRTLEGGTAGEARFRPGAFLVHGGTGTRDRVSTVADEFGVDFIGLDGLPAGPLAELRKPRVGIYKSWTANIDEGWTRWVLQDQYSFVLDTLSDARIRRDDLSGYDAIVLPAQSARSMLEGNAPGTMPDEYVGGLGEAGAAALERYVRAGGRLVALDGAGDFVIQHLDLPVRSLREGLRREEFTIPGSLLRIRIDAEHPLGFGMPTEAAAFFVERRGSNSRPYQILDPAKAEAVAWWGEEDILLSGYELGAADHLSGHPAMVRVSHGEGEVVLIGFRSQFRGYPRGTFKLLFNSLYRLDFRAVGEDSKEDGVEGPR